MRDCHVPKPIAMWLSQIWERLVHIIIYDTAFDDLHANKTINNPLYNAKNIPISTCKNIIQAKNFSLKINNINENNFYNVSSLQDIISFLVTQQQLF
jgi:hypothetical protein